MKIIKYKILRKDDGQVFGPFILGVDSPVIIGKDLEYLLYTTRLDDSNVELYEGDRVKFNSEGTCGEGEIIWSKGCFSVKKKDVWDGCLLLSCTFIKRLGSIYDVALASAGGKDAGHLAYGLVSKEGENGK